jgi:hypothetical protein
MTRGEPIALTVAAFFYWGGAFWDWEVREILKSETSQSPGNANKTC